MKRRNFVLSAISAAFLPLAIFSSKKRVEAAILKKAESKGKHQGEYEAMRQLLCIMIEDLGYYANGERCGEGRPRRQEYAWKMIEEYFGEDLDEEIRKIHPKATLLFTLTGPTTMYLPNMPAYNDPSVW